MLIRCPECLFERKVDLSKIPATAQLATCPKCRYKFRFREYIVGNTDAELEAIHPSLDEAAYIPAPDYPSFREAGGMGGGVYDRHAPDESSDELRGRVDDDEDVAAHTADYGSNSYPYNDAVPYGEASAETAASPDSCGSPLAYPEEGYVEDVPQHAEGAGYPSGTDDAVSHTPDHMGAMPSLDPVEKETPASTWVGGSFASPRDVEEEVVVKPHRHLGTISDFGDEHRHRSGKGDIWDAIAAMGDDDTACGDSFVRHSALEVEVFWENRGKLSLASAWLQTVAQVLFTPSQFFRVIKGAGGVTSPFLFFLLTSMIGVALEVGGLVLVSSMWPEALPAVGLNLSSFVFDMHTAPIIAADFLGEAFIRVLVVAIAYHVALRLSGSRCKPFATTFRVMAYSSATALICIIPVAGIIISRLWFLVLSVVGMHHAHALSWRKTILVILPLYMVIMIASILLSVLGG